jgi:hypothetical protein
MTGRLAAQAQSFREIGNVVEVEAASLRQVDFYAHFVQRMKPCIVRGAVRHWKAFDAWKSPEYLGRQITDTRPMPVQFSPLIEMIHEAPESPRSTDQKDRSKDVKLQFSEFMKRVTSDTDGHCALHAEPLAIGSPFEALRSDVSGFPFLPNARPPRLCADYRMFIYRQSYTDWHFHVCDETLMCQVKGQKEVLLFPPDAQSFASLIEIIRRVGCVYDVDPKRFPSFAKLRPTRAVVGAGDALFIPTFWWHAVESVERDWGITLAWCWASPGYLFDARLAGVRYALRLGLFTKYGPKAVVGALYSLLRRALTGQLGKSPFAAGL